MGRGFWSPEFQTQAQMSKRKSDGYDRHSRSSKSPTKLVGLISIFVLLRQECCLPSASAATRWIAVARLIVFMSSRTSRWTKEIIVQNNCICFIDLARAFCTGAFYFCHFAPWLLQSYPLACRLGNLKFAEARMVIALASMIFLMTIILAWWRRGRW